MRTYFGVLGLLMATSVIAQGALGTAALAQDGVPVDFSGVYFCKMTASGGLFLNETNKQWEPTSFRTDHKAYTVKITKTDVVYRMPYVGAIPTYNVNVKEFSNKQEENDCWNEGIDGVPSTNIPIDGYGAAICNSFATNYKLNLISLKIQVYFQGGYMFDENDDTPYVSVGKCDKIG